jgi:signal transduction histidine kinase
VSPVESVESTGRHGPTPGATKWLNPLKKKAQLADGCLTGMVKPITNSGGSQAGQRSQTLWLPSLLLLAQFLTITPVLLIVFADEQQRRTSDGYLTLLDGLDRLSLAIEGLENVPRPEEAWRQQYSNYKEVLSRVLSASAATPEIRDTLARVDSIVTRMARTESDVNKNEDGRAARSELFNAERSVRLELSTTTASIAQRTTYLKALVAGACLLAFGVVFVVRRFRVDTTIQRKLQRELQTANEEVIAALSAARSESAAKNRFLAQIGHLIVTPLNSIVSGTGQLLQTELTGWQRECAQASLGLAESLAKVADQVVDYSRMESGSLKLESSEFEPARLATDVVQLFVPAADRKGLKLRCSIQDGLPGAVKGDPERLRQVLINLLSNAVRFTQHGEISVRVEQTAGPEERSSLRFEVRDTGIGITELVRNRLFQPFSIFQPIDPDSNQIIVDRATGTGLGLAISKKLVELMGGRIEIASEPGRGSTFSFTASFTPVSPSAGASKEARAESSPAVSSAADTSAGAGVGTLRTVNPQTRGAKEQRDRRTELRHGINYPTLLRAENAGIAVIRVLDVSASGLRVSVPFRLLPRTEVEIRIEGTSVVGVVRNCTRIAANEFHVGIKIPRETSVDDLEHLNHLKMLRIELT